ncbi:hypothetical protein TcYC6_0038790 [Trypanosoma cruzi]|nr:hypothetical protein TcYC6_0038790 [Trypanosoma cruzi]
MWSRTVSPASTEQGLPRASVPVAESIGTGRGTPPKDVDTAALQKHPSPEEKWIRPGCPDRPQEASLGGRDRSSETDGRQDTPPNPGDDTVASACPCPLLLLLVSAAAVATLYGVAVWTALRCEVTVLPPAWLALSIVCPIENIHFNGFLSPYACAVSAPFLCLKLVVFTMHMALLVLVADVGATILSHGIACVFVRFS